MSRNPKTQRNRIFLLLILLTLAYSSVIQLKGETQEIQVATQQHYWLTTPGNIYEGDQVNISFSIKNIHIQVILNVTIHVTIPNEVEFVNSSFSDLIVENDTSEFEYQIGTIAVDEIIFMSFEYNVTYSGPGTDITFEGVNTSFQLTSQIDPEPEISNSVDVLLKGPRVDTSTASLPTKQIGTIDADDVIIVVAYLIPIAFFGTSIVVMRRIRR
ncbi:MAG: hypothetical protein ACXAC6_12925 [Candidatus Hodarchaeales archaeon]